MFKELQQMIDDVNASNSNNDKIEALAKYPNLEKVLRYTYSPMKQYYVSSKTVSNHDEEADFTKDDTKEEFLFQILDRLNERTLSGHAALVEVLGFVEAYKEYEELIYKIIDRNLKIRMNAASINKVFPNLIPEFKVQLAEKFEADKSPDFEKEVWYSSRKLDGCLDYDTIVEFEDGTKEKIGEVVRNKIDKRIKSYNLDTNEVEYKKILNFMEDLDDINETETQWYEVELEDGTVLRLTGNHRVWIPELKCWRRTDELDGSEFLLK